MQQGVKDTRQLSNQRRSVVFLDGLLEGVDVGTRREKTTVTGQDHRLGAPVVQALVNGFGDGG